MRLQLFWRLVVPTLGISILLLMLGLGAALYVYLWNSRVADDLHHQLELVMAAEELVLSIRDVRVDLDRYIATRDTQFIEYAKETAATLAEHMAKVQRHASSSKEINIDQLQRNVNKLVKEFNSLFQPNPGNVELVREQINTTVLVKASELLKSCREAAFEESRRNQQIAGMVGTNLAILGLCVAAAGLLAGYGVARSIARSIEQLGGSVQTMAHTLADEQDRDVAPIEGLRELIMTMSRISEKTAGVVSELEQSRETAARVDQMAAVGQLAAGIAHELRNPLTAIKLLVDTATEREELLPASDLAVVQEEVGRMDSMLRLFLDFARPPKLYRRAVDLSDVVTQVIDLVRPRARGHNVSINCQIPGPILLTADAQQIRQVIVNVMMNAIDAQPDGGAIDVRVTRNDADCPPACLIQISDSGPGISPEVAPRLFEPFVSTKETGVGLGLAICRRIVRSHGGEIEARNLADGGTIFSIYIPEVEIPHDQTS